jgi:hypothetical protein
MHLFRLLGNLNRQLDHMTKHRVLHARHTPQALGLAENREPIFNNLDTATYIGAPKNFVSVLQQHFSSGLNALQAFAGLPSFDMSPASLDKQ